MPPEDEKPDVLSSLPRTRPQRPSARRDAARKPAVKASEPAARKPAARKATARKPAPRKPAAGKRTAKPRVTAAAPPRIPPAGFAPPADTRERAPGSGVELVGTAIQAAGELVQIGAAIGGQALKSALGRLGRS